MTSDEISRENIAGFKVRFLLQNQFFTHCTSTMIGSNSSCSCNDSKTFLKLHLLQYLYHVFKQTVFMVYNTVFIGVISLLYAASKSI